MADENAMNDEAGAIELRPCSYCGTDIHPSSHRCVTCGGHVGLSWGTVHKELFLFLFASILIGVGCIASWAVRSPTGDADPSNGLRTIRGCVMFALAIYGVTSAYFSILNRKMVVWPFLLNALIALWVGIPAITGTMGGTAWKAWSKLAETGGGTLMDKWFGSMRAIPPGLLLVAIGGTLVAISILKGLVGGFVSGAAKSKAAQEAAGAKGVARRRGARGGDAAGAGETSPAGDPGHDTAG